MKLYVIAAAVLATALSLYGCSGHKETSQQYLSKALRYHKNGDDAAAVVELKNAIQSDPNNGQTRYLMALIQNERGQGSAAEVELRKALKLGVDKQKVNAALGQSLLLQGEFKKVLTEVKPAANVEGQLAAAIYTARGNAFLGIGKADEAKTSFDRALKEDPNYSDAYLGMAKLAAGKRDFKEALRQTGIALSKSPRNIAGWILKGDLSRIAGTPKDATAAYKKALEIDKSNISARLSLALTDITSGQYDRARSLLASADKISPKDNRVTYLRALLNFSEGKYEGARDALQQVMKGAPDYVPGVLLGGMIAYELGSYEQARKNLAVVLLQYPDLVYALKFLVATDLRLGRVSDALKHIDKLRSQHPKDPETLALASEAYMQRKDYAKATALLTQAVNLKPSDAQLQVQLAVSRLTAGDRKRAISDLGSAVSLDPKLFKADALLVAVRLGQKEYGKALEAAAAWQRKQPDNPVVYNLEGLAYVGKADVSRARKSFEKALTVRSDYLPAATNLAQLDLREKHPDAARTRLEAFLKADKDNLDVLLALAGVAKATHDDAGMEKWLERAVKSHPGDLQARQLLVSHYLTAGHAKKALAVARDAQSAKPDDPDALDLLGKVQVALGDKNGALNTYTKLANAVPQSPLAYLKLARAQEAVKHIPDAEASLKQALSLKPDYMEAKIALASLKATSGGYGDALKMAREIEKQYPKSPAGPDLEGNILMQQKKYLRAAKAYERANQVADDAVVVGQIYRAYALAGDLEQGVRVLQERIKKHPEDVNAQLALAQSYIDRHQDAAAVSHYEAILKKFPRNVFALNNLAWLYYQAHDKRALDVAEHAYKLYPKAFQTADTLGWILAEQGKVARAVPLLRKAFDMSNGEPSVGYHYAAALAKSGEKKEAHTQLEALLSSGRPFPEREAAKRLLDGL